MDLHELYTLIHRSKIFKRMTLLQDRDHWYICSLVLMLSACRVKISAAAAVFRIKYIWVTPGSAFEIAYASTHVQGGAGACLSRRRTPPRRSDSHQSISMPADDLFPFSADADRCLVALR